MDELVELVLDQFKQLIKYGKDKKKYALESEIDKLNLSNQEKGFIRLVFKMNDVNVVSEIPDFIVSESRPKRVKDYTYGEVEDNDIEYLDEAKMATIKYDGKELVYENYDELDKFINNIFIPDNVQMKVNYSRNRKDYSMAKPYPSIQLNKIVKLGLSEAEVKHVCNLLDSQGIHIGGISSDLDGKFKNYDYISTGEIVNKYCRDLNLQNLPWSQMRDKFIEFYETKDDLLREELILRNVRLVDYFSWKIAKYHEIDVEDAKSYGYEGLIYAVGKYNPYQDAKFSTYAEKCIRGSILRGISRTHKGEIPQNFIFTYMKAKKIVESENGMTIEEDPSLLDEIIKFIVYNKLYEEKGFVPNTADVDMLDENDPYIREEMKEIRTIIGILNLYSIEELSEEKEIPYNDMDLNEVLDSTVREQLKKNFDRAFNDLTRREQKILELRYGLIDGVERTLGEVATIFWVTRERIRQIEAKALRKLRHPRYRFLYDRRKGDRIEDASPFGETPEIFMSDFVEKDPEDIIPEDLNSKTM